MSNDYSVSLAYGKTAEHHDRREYTPANAERTLEGRNVVILDCGDIHRDINDFYGPAIARYNDKQTRADRKKSEDYYTALQDGTEGYGSKAKGTQEHPVYEYVLQIGNKDDNGVTDNSFDAAHWQALKQAGKYDEAAKYAQQHLNNSPDREKLKDVLTDFARRLPEMYPNLHFTQIVGHDDEPGGTYHIQFSFSPFVTGQKTGLDTRVSMRGALKAMGITQQGSFSPLEVWKNDIKDRLVEDMQAHGYDRKYMSNAEEHLAVDDYKREQRIKELEEQVSDLEASNIGLQEEKERLEEMVLGNPFSRLGKAKTRVEADLQAKQQELADMEAKRAEAERQAAEATREAQTAAYAARVAKETREREEAVTEALQDKQTVLRQGCETLEAAVKSRAAGRVSPQVTYDEVGRRLQKQYPQAFKEIVQGIRREKAQKVMDDAKTILAKSQSLDDKIASAYQTLDSQKGHARRPIPGIDNIKTKSHDDDFSL